MARATSYAAQIQSELGISCDLEDGRRGQFEVRVDGRTVIERKGGLFAMLTKRPWPEASEVVDAVRAAVAAGPS